MSGTPDDGPLPRDLGKAMDGAAIANSLPYIADAIKRMESTLDSRVFQEIQDGTLTPDKALYAWLEKVAYRRLIKRLTQYVKVGIAAGERAVPHLEGDDNATP